MEQQNSFKKIVGWLTIISVPFAFANFTLTGIASGSGSDLYSLYKAGEEAGNLMKWPWLAEIC